MLAADDAGTVPCVLRENWYLSFETKYCTVSGPGVVSSEEVGNSSPGLCSPVLLDSVYYCYYCPVALVGVAERGAGLEPFWPVILLLLWFNIIS